MKSETSIPFHPLSLPIDLGLGQISLESVAENGQDRYAPPLGLPGLREIIGDRHHVSSAEVCITAGASLALAATLASLPPGSDILCPRPYYPPYPVLIRAFGHSVVFYELSSKANDIEIMKLEALITENTRAILLNVPANPSGNVISIESLETLCNLTKHLAIELIVDEVAAEFIFDDELLSKYNSLKYDSHVVRIRSISKSFARPGFRIGYAIGTPSRIARIAQFHWTLSLGASLSNQIIFYDQLLKRGWVQAENNRIELKRKCVLAMSFLKDYALEPSGGIFFWINCRDAKSADNCAELLSQESITVMKGYAFGCPAYLRICYGIPEWQLQIALPRIRHHLRLLLPRWQSVEKEVP
jgi:aspartate aminotransferase